MQILHHALALTCPVAFPPCWGIMSSSRPLTSGACMRVAAHTASSSRALDTTRSFMACVFWSSRRDTSAWHCGDECGDECDREEDKGRYDDLRADE